MTNQEYLELPTVEKILGIKRIIDDCAAGHMQAGDQQLKALSFGLQQIASEVRVLRNMVRTKSNEPKLTMENLASANVVQFPVAPKYSGCTNGETA